MTKALTMIKAILVAASIAVLSACGGGGDVVVVDGDNAFLSVDNLNVSNGVVCIEDIFLDARSDAGQQVARDLVDFYKTRDFSLNPYHQAYSAPTVCGGETSNYTPYPGLIISASYYYDVIVPYVR